jgi:hypothetical protein
MQEKLAVAVLVGIILFGGLTAIGGAYEDSVGGSGEHNAVVNESFVVTHDSRVTLVESEQPNVVYDRQTNISVFQNGTAVAASGNWSWARDNGTLVIASAAPGLANESTATATYGYRSPTNTQQLALDVAGFPMAIGDALMLLFVVALFGAGMIMLTRRL